MMRDMSSWIFKIPKHVKTGKETAALARQHHSHYLHGIGKYDKKKERKEHNGRAKSICSLSKPMDNNISNISSQPNHFIYLQFTKIMS